MKILIAPDSFKGSASATQVAAALAEGWRSVRADDNLVTLPQADGGEGTLEAIAGSANWQWRQTQVCGPHGRPVSARWLLHDDGRAVAELAESSGIALMPRLDPWGATSRGLGEVIAAALAAGATSVQVGLGGSASTDGGAGLLMALGLEAFDARGNPIGDGARGLAEMKHIDPVGLPPLPRDGVEILVDTEAPLYGPRGAAAVFGPQKGATAEDISSLDEGLRRWARLLAEAGFAADPEQPGAGAAGGAGFGLLAWGAQAVSGSQRIGALTGLHEQLSAADVVVTGEGRFDDTSLGGKLVGHVLSAARGADVAAVVVAGQVATTADVSTVSLTELAGTAEAAIGDPLRWLRAAGAVAAQRV